MSEARLVPQCGDAIWIELRSHAGGVFAKRRPAMVLSPSAYNSKVGMALLCPIVSRAKGYPFEVLIPAGFGVSGVVLADRVECLSWRTGNAEVIAPLPNETVDEVLEKVGALLQRKPG